MRNVRVVSEMLLI